MKAIFVFFDEKIAYDLEITGHTLMQIRNMGIYDESQNARRVCAPRTDGTTVHAVVVVVVVVAAAAAVAVAVVGRGPYTVHVHLPPTTQKNYIFLKPLDLLIKKIHVNIDNIGMHINFCLFF